MVRESGRMKVEVLGPWVAAPAAGTTSACSSYVVSGASTVLLDCGPGTVPLLQQRDLTRRLDAIVISHMDPDHVLGLVELANLRMSARLLSRAHEPRKLRLFVPREDGVETLAALEGVWEDGQATRTAPVGDAEREAPSRNRFTEAFELVEYGGEDRVELDGLSITFQRTSHARPCFSPRLTDGSGATIVYSADTGYAPEIIRHAKGADLLLCEATLLETHPYWTEQHGHLTGALAGKLAAEAGVGRLILTHLGPDQEINLSNLENARGEFGGVVDLAQSGGVFHV